MTFVYLFTYLTFTFTYMYVQLATPLQLERTKNKHCVGGVLSVPVRLQDKYKHTEKFFNLYFRPN